MAFEEKTLSCSDCGQNFVFTVEEQELFKSKGYTNEPKRCPACRQARKAAQAAKAGNDSFMSKGYSSPRREMYPVKCAECGKDTQVPFQPRGDRPVYCSDCFRKIKPAK